TIGLNRFIDYEQYKTKSERVQKLYNDNNGLSIFKSDINSGFLTIPDSTNSVYKIRVSDYKRNDAWITIPIKGVKPKNTLEKSKTVTPYYIYANSATNLKEGKVSVDISPNSFYDDFYIDFKVSNDTLFLGEDIVPMKKYFSISYDISNYSEADRNKLYIARLIGYRKYPSYEGAIRKGTILSCTTRGLGTFALATDDTKPTITPINFKKDQWLSNYRYLQIKIDDTGAGISNYRATINDTWILTEYDYKTKTLTYDFNDGISTETKNNLKIIVTENVGNSANCESVFYTKYSITHLKTVSWFAFFFFFAITLIGYSQTATVRGIILNEENQPISGVNIKAGISGTQTNENGFFIIKIPANQDVEIEFTHLSHKK